MEEGQGDLGLLLNNRIKELSVRHLGGGGRHCNDEWWSTNKKTATVVNFFIF